MKTNLMSTMLIVMLSAGLLMTGCEKSDETAKTNTSNNTTSTDKAADTNAALPNELFLTAAPDGAQTIANLKKFAKEGDEVVVNVIVGGRMKPIVDGRASATIIDAAVKNACLAEEDHCETPWDYCCAAPEEVTPNLATLQVVDKDGRVIAANLSEKIKPLSTLTVKGVVGPRPDSQVLQINATGIYVKPAGQ